MKKAILLLIITFGFININAQNITIDNINRNNIGNNALRFNINFSTNEATFSYVEYQYQNADGELITSYSNIDTILKTYHLHPIVGLRANTPYQFRVGAFNETGAAISDWQLLQTPPLPSGIMDNNIENDVGNLDGYMLTDVLGGMPQAKIIDRSARVVWYQPFMNTTGTTCLSYHFTKDYTLVYTDCHVITEIALDGTILHQIPIPEQYFLHHDIIVNDQNQYVVLRVKAEVIDKSSIGGDSESLVAVDGFLVVEKDGTIVQDWSASEHIDPIEEVNNGGFWTGTLGPTSQDWLHANAVFQQDDGDYLFSMAHKGQIACIDGDTYTLNWTFGTDGDFDLAFEDEFYYQHAISFTKDKTYLLYDNRGLSTGQCRALEFRLDTNNFTVEKVWEYVLPNNLFSPIIGSVYRLENGHSLIGTGVSGRVIELDENGEELWHSMQMGGAYRASFLPNFLPPAPKLSTSATSSTSCIGGESISLSTNLTGGFWQGEGIVENVFDPSLINEAGSYELIYSYAWLTDTLYIEVMEAIDEVPIVTQEASLLTSSSAMTYQWYMDGELIEGATQQNYNAIETGWYTVVVTYDDGCSNTFESEMVWINILSIKDFDNHYIRWQINGNPYQNQAQVFYILPNTSPVNLSVYDLFGNKMVTLVNNQQRAGEYTYDLATYFPKAGLYIVHLSVCGRGVSKKVVVSE